MFTNDMQLKEFIKIEDKKGKIIDINFLNTHIRTDDGDIILIPNSKLISEEITNYSKSQIKRIKFNFTLGSENYKYIDELEEYLTKNICEEYKHLVESEEEILIKAIEIKKDETQFRIEIIVSRFNFKIENKMNNYISKQIIKFLSDKKEEKTHLN
jgi:small-conductance mechanosensitive channel